MPKRLQPAVAYLRTSARPMSASIRIATRGSVGQSRLSPSVLGSAWWTSTTMQP